MWGLHRKLDRSIKWSWACTQINLSQYISDALLKTAKIGERLRGSLTDKWIQDMGYVHDVGFIQP